MPDFVDELEKEAREELKALRACRTEPGDATERRFRVRTALGMIGHYVRLRATIANERTNDLVAMRLSNAFDGAPEPKRLTE